MKWRKICSFRWESELTLAGGYAIDNQHGAFTVHRLKPRTSTKETMRWEMVGGAWSLPAAKRMALHDSDGTTKRFMEKARAERAAAREANVVGAVQADDGRVLTKVELPPVRTTGWGEFWGTIDKARSVRGGRGGP